jgi:hypothetical protein
MPAKARRKPRRAFFVDVYIVANAGALSDNAPA